MGFFLSFLIEINLGTDPCSFMNVSIANKIGITFGTWQLILNVILLALVIWQKKTLIGPGTVANMVFVGYIADFFRWVWGKMIPKYIFTDNPYRIIVFAAALLLFVVAAALYMNANVGVAPYDAVPMIVKDKLKKVPFSIIRILFDYTVVLIGALVSGGLPNVGVLVMALFLGPVISFVGKPVGKILGTAKAADNMVPEAHDSGTSETTEK